MMRHIFRLAFAFSYVFTYTWVTSGFKYLIHSIHHVIFIALFLVFSGYLYDLLSEYLYDKVTCVKTFFKKLQSKSGEI